MVSGVLSYGARDTHQTQVEAVDFARVNIPFYSCILIDAGISVNLGQDDYGKVLHEISWLMLLKGRPSVQNREVRVVLLLPLLLIGGVICDANG
jgi:hypothetical protein